MYDRATAQSATTVTLPPQHAMTRASQSAAAGHPGAKPRTDTYGRLARHPVQPDEAGVVARCQHKPVHNLRNLGALRYLAKDGHKEMAITLRPINCQSGSALLSLTEIDRQGQRTRFGLRTHSRTHRRHHAATAAFYWLGKQPTTEQ